MTLAIGIGLALAAPPDFTEVKSADGCVLAKGPTDPDGVTPMHATCHWPEVDPSVLQARLADEAAYDELIFAITVSEVVRRDGDRALVHQVQQTRGIAVREVLIWMASEPVDGGMRFRWETAADEPLQVAEGHIRSPRNDGYWEVRPHPAGGASVVHHIAYAPGGSVPGWVVRWFQIGGMLEVMRDVRRSAAAPAELIR